MKLDHHYIERSEALERESRAGIGLYGYVGHQEMREGDDFRDFLTRESVTYRERIVPTVGTWEGNAHELQYHRPEQADRYAYLLDTRPDVDVWSQAVYIFSQPVPDEQLADTLRLIRQQEEDLDPVVYERQRELDRKYLPYWRLINYNWEMAIIAYHLVRYGWTQRVEALLKQWGAYKTQEGVGPENLLVQSLLEYGKLIMAQKEPDHYIQGLLEKRGREGRRYRNFIESGR